jgi:glutathione synthase/RimK-type ligase-like ATP-grasp enzyme
MAGGPGGAYLDDRSGLRLQHDKWAITPDVVIVYEIDPGDRDRLGGFLDVLAASGVHAWGADRYAWRNATDKEQTVACFARHGIPHAETVTFGQPDRGSALQAFAGLGGDVWARPVSGLGGRDVFHLRTASAVVDAVDYYARRGQRWQMCRDADNIDHHGNRHQFRVVVHHDQALRVCEHLQRDHDRPCNEAQGALSTVVPLAAVDPALIDLAVAATRSVGLAFGGVDLAVEHGGTVFEVNVHPALDVPGGLETVALPLIDSILNPPT